MRVEKSAFESVKGGQLTLLTALIQILLLPTPTQYHGILCYNSKNSFQEWIELLPPGNTKGNTLLCASVCNNVEISFYSNRNIFCFKCLSWYHDLTRNSAEVLLLAYGNQGSYLIRPSKNNEGNYTISVRSVIFLIILNSSG